jgi:chemotaxis protein MotB
VLFRKKQDIDDEENLDRWLLTYADLITLLLAFFVVMYSVSRIDAGKFNKVTDALVTAFKGPELGVKSTKDLTSELAINKQLKKGNLGILEGQVQKIAQQLSIDKQVTTDLQTRGLIIHISESAFFDPGKAELKPEAKMILDLLSVQLLKIPNHIRVEGHTDNIPIHNKQFPSNWELSAFRATACLRYLVDKIGFPPDRISAVGYAEFRPIASNDTPEDRAKNRRVDIVVMSLDQSYLEPEERSDEPRPAADTSVSISKPANIM